MPIRDGCPSPAKARVVLYSSSWIRLSIRCFKSVSAPATISPGVNPKGRAMGFTPDPGQV